MNRGTRWRPRGRSRLGRRPLLVSALSGVGVSLWLAACGGGEQKPTTVGQTTGPAGTGTMAAGAATPQPKRGGVGLFNFPLDAPHLDLHQTTTLLLHSYGPGGSPYSRLVRYKIPPEVPTGVTGEVAPDLAASWEQPEPTTVVFRLRPNAAFHPIPPVNGRQATAADVAYSFRRQLDLRTNASLLPAMDSFEAVDVTTFRIKLKQPDADVLTSLAYWTNKVVAREAVELKGDLKEGPTIGTGPFMLDEWRPKEVTTFKRNPNYFLPGLPYLDGYKWLRISDASTQLSAFRTRQLHWLSVNKEQLDQIVREEKDVESYQEKRTGTVWVNFRVDMKPFDDIRVRKALIRAINMEQIMQIAFAGSYFYTPGITVPSLDWWLPESELKILQKTDRDEARMLLQQAGVTNLTVDTGVLNITPVYGSVAELMQNQLKNVGIILNLRPIDNVEYAAALSPANKFPLLIGASSPGPSTTVDLQSRFSANGSRNGSGIKDPKLDDLIARQAAELNPDARRRLLADVQRYLLENVYQFCMGQLGNYVYRSSFKGFKNTWNQEYETWTYTWLDT
jgi:peptide/nickel transport system substrate-binding protein